MSEKSTMQYTDNNGTPLDFDPSIPEEERRFYMKMYSTIDQVRDKKVHCTTCKIHIGTAPAQEEFIRMHPVLRVTHCIKCHDFYNSGEFSKGEDGSELYCRWCGQGGEVYCCSSCPYVFCKSCIVKNLTRGVVADIEQNENWSCFSCAPKILWPLRAQHWALVSYIEKQKRDILARKLPESEEKILFAIDRSNCCRQSKTKCGNMSDSVESIDSIHSRSSMGSTNPLKKPFKPTSTSFTSLAKRPKTSNDEVVCTPDVLSMLEPDCQITVSPKPRPLTSPITSTPKVLSVQTGYGSSSAQQNKSTTAPPPLVLRNTEIQMRALGTSPIMRRTVLSQRAPSPGNVSAAPVYHTINGYRIDLNSAALQDTFRLPNGKLIQVKRQGTAANTSPTTNNTNWQQRATTPLNFNSRPVQITPAQPQAHYANITQQHPISSATSNQQPQIMRFNNFVTNNSNSPVTQNGTHIQMINGVPAAPIQVQQSPVTVRPVILKHLFPNTPIGQARTQLQEQVFSAMDICQHLTGKIQTLTNSNAYKQARNYLEVKELYIHLSYLLTYAVGRFKSLQDKCITDMRQLGFGADADSLENGQLAAGVDYVCYGQLEDVDLFNTGSNSFHNQVYNYRKSLHANLKDEDHKESLEPYDNGENSLLREADYVDDSWQMDQNDEVQECDDNDEPEETYMDAEEDADEADESFQYQNSGYLNETSARRNTEDVMSREEESHAFDRKLSTLIKEYPSIWCTRHPDYGNFEVTRKQWRKIQSNFKRSDDIKLRWKNIRKRYVRIERRLAEGKRFNGYFDESTSFLANRDLALEDWIDTTHGDEVRGTFDESQTETLIELAKRNEMLCKKEELELQRHAEPLRHPVKPIEIRSTDLKIISFVTGHQILWRKPCNKETMQEDEKKCQYLWARLTKLVQSTNVAMTYQDVVDRWAHLYEMYKTFRLKSIKDETILANLELKYAKYLAKLFFLYKIDEEDLKKENELDEMDDIHLDNSDNSNDSYAHDSTKLQDMEDDKEFLLELVHAMKNYPSLWDIHNLDFNNYKMREQHWREIETKLQEFKRDLKTIKLRWRLAKFSYMCIRLEDHITTEDNTYSKCLKNLPVDEMSYLCF